MRNLERKLAGICRKVAFKIVKGKGKGAQVTEKNLENIWDRLFTLMMISA